MSEHPALLSDIVKFTIPISMHCMMLVAMTKLFGLNRLFGRLRRWKRRVGSGGAELLAAAVVGVLPVLCGPV